MLRIHAKRGTCALGTEDGANVEITGSWRHEASTSVRKSDEVIAHYEKATQR